MTQVLDEGTGLAINSRRAALADACVRYHFNQHPELRERYGEQGVAKCVQDANFHLAFLADAIASSVPAVFSAYIQWARSMLAARNIPRSDLAESLAALRVVVAQELPAQDAQIAAEYLDHALSRIDDAVQEPPYLAGDDPLAVMARDYLDAMLRGERRSATSLISDAVARGTPVRDIYLRVFQPVLYEIGRLWQANEISVAQEHYSSAATQLIMSQLYPLIFRAERRGKTLVAAGVSGDMHEIGLRTVADFFEMAGWDTFYLGANVPIPDLLRLLVDHHADVLALSATIAFHVGAVRETIRRVRSSAECKGLLILVGGYPFNIAGDLWRKVGADGGARDAAGALALAEDLLKNRPAE
jgi:MerR family transcriptional regulator, light-induced transcriptional regulator